MRFAGRLMDLVHVTSRVQIARYRRPSSVAIASHADVTNNCSSPDTDYMRVCVSETKKESTGNFNAKCAALHAQILTLNYCAEVGVRISRRVACYEGFA